MVIVPMVTKQEGTILRSARRLVPWYNINRSVNLFVVSFLLAVYLGCNPIPDCEAVLDKAIVLSLVPLSCVEGASIADLSATK